MNTGFKRADLLALEQLQKQVSIAINLFTNEDRANVSGCGQTFEKVHSNSDHLGCRQIICNEPFYMQPKKYNHKKLIFSGPAAGKIIAKISGQAVRQF